MPGWPYSPSGGVAHPPTGRDTAEGRLCTPFIFERALWPRSLSRRLSPLPPSSRTELVRNQGHAARVASRLPAPAGSVPRTAESMGVPRGGGGGGGGGGWGCRVTPPPPPTLATPPGCGRLNSHVTECCLMTCRGTRGGSGCGGVTTNMPGEVKSSYGWI